MRYICKLCSLKHEEEWLDSFGICRQCRKRQMGEGYGFIKEDGNKRIQSNN